MSALANVMIFVDGEDKGRSLFTLPKTFDDIKAAFVQEFGSFSSFVLSSTESSARLVPGEHLQEGSNYVCRCKLKQRVSAMLHQGSLHWRI
jgi:hypothetical protein